MVRTSSSPNPGAIVVVEDPIVRRYIKNVLRRAGHDVIESDPASALSLVRENEVRVKLMITNVPALFRPFASELPLLYLAASPDPSQTSGFREARVLRKPFLPVELMEAVGAIAGSQ